jgi:multiple sugar transport system substrate-binding protein
MLWVHSLIDCSHLSNIFYFIKEVFLMQKVVFKCIKQTVSCFLAVAMIGILATGCKTTATNSSSNPGKVTVTFWNTFTGSDANTLKSLVNDFNQQNTGKIQINMNIMSSDVFNQKLPISIASKTAPDLVTLNVADVLTYEKEKSIEDLSDFFSKTGTDQTNFVASSLKIGYVDSKQYGLPMQVFDSTNMYWNKDLFKAAGLDPDSPPKTFDELAADAVKLTNVSKNQYGFGMCASAAPQFYSVFIRGNGGSVVDMSAKKSVLNSATNIATFEWLHTLAYTNNVSPKSTGGVDMDNLMQSGRLGIYFDGPWLEPGLKSHNINFGIGQVPSGSSGISGVLDGTLFAIPTGTKGNQKTAIYAFLKYWNSTSVGRQWSLSDGMPPYLNSVINDPEIKADATISAFASNMSNSVAWNSGLESAGKIDSDVLFPLIAQLQTNCNVSDVVNKASSMIDTLLQSEK